MSQETPEPSLQDEGAPGHSSNVSEEVSETGTSQFEPEVTAVTEVPKIDVAVVISGPDRTMNDSVTSNSQALEPSVAPQFDSPSTQCNKPNLSQHSGDVHSLSDRDQEIPKVPDSARVEREMNQEHELDDPQNARDPEPTSATPHPDAKPGFSEGDATNGHLQASQAFGLPDATDCGIPPAQDADSSLEGGGKAQAIHRTDETEVRAILDPVESLSSPPSAPVKASETQTPNAQTSENERPKLLSKRFFNKKKDRSAPWGNGLAQEAASRFHAVQAERASAAMAADDLKDNAQEPDNIDDVSWMEQKSESEDDPESAAKAFNELKKAYLKKIKKDINTEEDDINFAVAEEAEQKRLRRLRGKRNYEEFEAQQDALQEARRAAIQAQEQENSMFCADDRSPSTFPMPKPSVKKARTASSEIDVDALIKTESKRKGNRSRKPIPKKLTSSKTTKSRSISKAAPQKNTTRQRHGRKERPRMSNVQSLFSNTILADAKANEDLAEQPTFGDTKMRRHNLVTQLMASVAQPSKEDKLVARQDKQAILDAIKQLSSKRTIKPELNNSTWKLKGMQTSLKHFQLLGVGWMRERENSTKRPYGGLQCDQMGLGKTIQIIATIIDGRPPKSSRCKATLIVVPSQLQKQWMKQFSDHVEKDTLPRITQYSASKHERLNPIQDLEEQDVVITSYAQVAKSYPHCSVPPECTTEAQKNEWWAKHYAENRGNLHRVYWYRIVIDECHAIKTVDGKTSIAVRTLSGKYRWALSGTPCTNTPIELYPLMNFLRVENTGSQELFMQNFGKTTSAAALKRLHVLLSMIMIRRTHADRLFNLPLLKLPRIQQTTISVQFNQVERSIYQIVRARFAAKIHTFKRDGLTGRKHQSIFVLLLRLRMLVSHVLLIQSTLETVLEAEDLERLWELSENPEMRTDAGDTGRAMLRRLKSQIKQAWKAQVASGQDVENVSTNSYPTTRSFDKDSNGTGRDFGVAYHFRNILKDLRKTERWDELNKISTCKKCFQPAQVPRIADPCGHLYCKSCLEWLEYQARQLETDETKCAECHLVIRDSKPLRGFEEAGDFVLTNPGASSPDSQKALDAEKTDWVKIGGNVLYSAKTLGVKSQVLDWLERTPDAKIIIFTQFLGMVKILGRICHEERWGYVTLTGTQSFDSRDRAIQKFAEEDDCKIMLASMRCGGIGLNLTMASKVILLDLWWNDAAEAQAFCRVYRIGQTQDVEVVRFVVDHTIDEDIVRMQQRKTEHINRALDKEAVNTKWSTHEIAQLFDPENPEFTGIEDPFIFANEETEDEDEDVDMETDYKLPARPL
ncbi:MAG: hypothetical protein Q9227_004485 [Pyrenula ochraceoflavens]